MRVRMKSIYAGPNGTVLPGAEKELSKKEAEGLIAAGYAEKVAETTQEKKETPEPKETATAPRAEENTMAAPPRRRRSK